jgi:cation transport regulator ChaB
MAEKQPHQETLSLDTIESLSDGQAKAVINAALASAIRDTEDRGEDGKERKVTVEIAFKKLGDSVTVGVKAKVAVPQYVTKPTIGRIVMNGRKPEVAFSPASATNPDQPRLNGIDGN